MHRLIAILFLVAFLFGAPYAAALINAAMGPWSATGIEHDGTQTHMQFGQNLPRPEWVPVYPNATIVQSSKVVSAALPSGFHALDLGIRASLDDIKQFYTERLTASGFEVRDRDLTELNLNPATAAFLGIAGSLTAVRAGTDGEIDIMIRTPDGWVFPSRNVAIRWNKHSETAAQRATLEQQTKR